MRSRGAYAAGDREGKGGRGGGVRVAPSPNASPRVAAPDAVRFAEVSLSATLSVFLGLVSLVVGGDILVRGAGRLAVAAGIRPLVVGLTVVAFCTSAPELAASIAAAYEGSPALAVGNVLGSNIANVGLILGIAGLVRPIEVRSTVLAREVPMMIGASLLLGALSWDGSLSRLDGLGMLAVLAGYLAVMVRAELRAQEPKVEAQVVESVGAVANPWASVALVLAGVAMLVVGADRLVDGATALAVAWGLSEAVVGLTVVAVGTSLPELAASVAAARNGQGDLVLGNVVGSNIFNVLCILGATAAIRPIEGGMADFSSDLWVMVGFAAASWPLLGRGRTLFRHEAALLLLGWVVYTVWIL